MRAAARQRFSSRSTTVCPIWCQQGWSRQRAGSVAEAELLAPLGEVLMPNTPIFGTFPELPITTTMGWKLFGAGFDSSWGVEGPRGRFVYRI